MQEALTRLGDAESGVVGGWWDRAHTHEYDVVIPDARSPRIRTVGSVKWRENTPFSVRDLAQLAECRHIVPGADDASLLAVCPAGVEAEGRPDVVVGAGELLGAWRGAVG